MFPIGTSFKEFSVPNTNLLRLKFSRMLLFFLTGERSYSREIWKINENSLINKIFDTFRLATYRNK